MIRRMAVAVLAALVIAYVWPVSAQVIPGSPFQGGGGGGGDTLPIVDTTAVVKGSSDDTKLLRFEVDGFTTGTTRVATFANADGIVAYLGSAQNWSADQSFSGGWSGPTTVTAVTTTDTPTAAESHEIFTNTGDTDGASITLLDNPTAGSGWYFAITAAQTLTIAPSTGETLYFGTDQCVASLTSNSIGSTILLRAMVGGSGGVFMTVASSGTWVCND